MAPFRPSNLNKRLYPGNANVVGPTIQATVGFSTDNFSDSTSVTGPCSEQNILGCRFTFCACPCCNVCCCCSIVTCTRTVPSGMWNTSEVYEARSRDAWGDTTCATIDQTLLCCTDLGITCIGASPITDCKGFFICCGPSTCKWFVAPSCTEVSRSWNNRADAVTVSNSLMGSCGWFIPSCDELSNPGYSCRTYWDSYCTETYYSDTEKSVNCAWLVDMSNGALTAFSTFGPPPNHNKSNISCVRAFRCTIS